MLHSKRYIDALKLRTNSYSVNVALAKADKEKSVLCRNCKSKSEMLGHVTGECVFGKGLHISRHNAVVEKIGREAEAKGFTVTKEPEHLVSDERCKPDLVLTDEARVLVVDVTVCYQNASSLTDTYKEKVRKYQPLADYLAGAQSTQ